MLNRRAFTTNVPHGVFQDKKSPPIIIIRKAKPHGRYTRTNQCIYTWLTMKNHNGLFCLEKLHFTLKRHNVGISMVCHQINGFLNHILENPKIQG